MLVWINRGRSPALHVKSTIRSKVIQLDEPIPTFCVEDGQEGGSGSSLGQDRPVETGPFPICDENYRAFMKNQIRWIIYAKITYRDVYTKSIARHTEVCGEIYFHGFRIGPDGKQTHYFSFRPIGDQNTAS
jgi:hypothetical protein